MPVLPCRPNLFVDYKDLYQFLLACQQKCLIRNCSQFVSISIEVDSIDPLVVLEKITQSDQLSFYFENKDKGEAIAAIGSVAQLKAAGKKRFLSAQEFINSCLTNTSTIGSTSTLAGPRFFCSFSFFSETQVDPFPAATVFLPRLQVARHGNNCILVVNLVVNSDTKLAIVLQETWQNVQEVISLKYTLHNNNQCSSIKMHVDNFDEFKRSVFSCLESIQCNHLSKVVLAHAMDISSKTCFDLFKSLNNLRSIYTNCYTFCISNGEGQHFIGASPERLINVHNQNLRTDALAGSAPRGKTALEDTELANLLLSSEKEQYEHQVVTNFITQRLCQLGIVPELLPLRLKQLSNIQHLWTPIQAKLPAHIHPLEIVAELHPTPAVAGVARDVACAEIRHYESFERGLYAAPLGWVDYQGNSEFIVGIRSALIDGDRARLYAGAGIVAGSDPSKEIAEIQLKLQALLKALA